MIGRDLRILAWCGVAAPLIYAVAVVAGGASIPGYDHIRDPISSLTEAGRSRVAWIQFLFGIYNLLVAIFGMWALATFRHAVRWCIAFGLLVLTAVCGVLMWPFAQDPIGTPATVPGVVHIVLAAIESLATIAIVGLSLAAFRAGGQRRLSWFSASCLAVIVLSGVVAAAATAGQWPMMGLFERLTIGAFEVWLAAIALRLALRRRWLAANGSAA